MDERRKKALLQTLEQDYGITNERELSEAIRNMEKIDITQFVCDRSQIR